MTIFYSPNSAGVVLIAVFSFKLWFTNSQVGEIFVITPKQIHNFG